MNNLDKAREIINQTDKEMAKLFEKRMNAVKEVAKYKIENGMPVFDEKRETEVIEKNSGYIENPELCPYYINFIKSTMDISKEFQNMLFNEIKISGNYSQSQLNGGGKE